jgi:CrcB protein
VPLTAGLLGGFTTYSAFAYGSLALIERRELGLAALYVGATVVGCLLACWAGVAAGRLVRG